MSITLIHSVQRGDTLWIQMGCYPKLNMTGNGHIKRDLTIVILKQTQWLSY